MPWAALQASILASEHDNKAILSPRVANGLFAGLGGFFFLGLIASNVVNTIAGERVWSQYEKAYGLLSRFEAEWTPTTNVVVPLLQVGPELQELNRRADYNQTCVSETRNHVHSRKLTLIPPACRCQVATISVWLLIPIIVIMVNLASLRLSRLLHRQVKWNIEHVRPRCPCSSQKSRLTTTFLVSSSVPSVAPRRSCRSTASDRARRARRRHLDAHRSRRRVPSSSRSFVMDA